MKSIAITYTLYLKRIMAFCTIVVVASAFLYGIFLLEAVGNTAARAKAEREIRTLSSRVGSLEQAYLQKTREITLARAKEMGFVAPKTVTTVLAADPLPLLSQNN